MESIKEVASVFSGLVVVDEAYIDFSNSKSATSLLAQVPNLVVLQTLSKAVGLAGLRLGVAFASNPIIQILNKVKPPYNVNSLSQAEGVATLQNKAQIEFQIQELKAQRTVLVTALESLSIVVKIYPSEANFLLVEFADAHAVFTKLKRQGIIIRNRTTQIKNCLRITVGTPDQNQLLITALKEI
jgi:histidinol-phosphate aminotransferase